MKSYEKAIALRPDLVAAHHNLSTLKAYQPNDPHIEIIENLFTDSEPGDVDRMRLCFTLAKVYEDIGNYGNSFYYLEEGNRVRKQALNYEIDEDRQLMTKIRAVFTARNPTLEFTQDGDALPQPLFVVGMPRSGTSLVEQILASHSKVHGAGELETMDNVASPILSNLPDQNVSPDKCQLSQREIKRVHDGYLEGLRALNVPERVIIDKMPHNFRWIGFILFAFPNAKVIHVNRDPRATCWSIYKHDFLGGANRYAYDQVDLVEFYKLYLDLMSFWRDRFPNRIYQLCYEDLTEDQEQQTRNLLAYCELEWQEQCLDFHETKRPVKTASAAQVRKRMYKGSSEAWRNYAAHLQPLITGLGY